MPDLTSTLLRQVIERARKLSDDAPPALSHGEPSAIAETQAALQAEPPQPSAASSTASPDDAEERRKRRAAQVQAEREQKRVKLAEKAARNK